jgi:hypothetical protein
MPDFMHQARVNRFPLSSCAFAAVTAAALSVIFLAGCSRQGPEIAPVEGTVYLDGKPLEGAYLKFQPPNGRPSVGATDANGEYEMIYSRQENGALVGEHTVSISTYQRGNREDGIPPVPEKLPTKYNSQSELKKTVEPRHNTIDFELDSEGRIATPSGE